MFFPNRILNIKPDDKVLDVGPGSQPYPRADVYLEKRFENKAEALEQSGFTQPKIIKDRTVYYDGGKFPFKDKEFDYVVCSHVLEHIPPKEVTNFISELERVASRGYIEFPNVFYELINYQNVHRWLMNYRDGTIYYLNKDRFKSSNIHKTYREMFYGRDTYMNNAFERYKEFFFCGFEWKDKIPYKIVKDFDFLVTNKDYKKYREYFSKVVVPESNYVGLGYKTRSVIEYAERLIFRYLGRVLKRGNYYVHKTAKLDDIRLISIGDHSEVKEYVIIQSYNSPVTVGQYTQLNPFTVIYGHSSVHIGDNVMIAPHCMIASGNHDFYQTDKPIRFAGNLTKGPIIIENNVWIGANSVILDGVKIGRDAVVGAGSVVTRDIAPYTIVAGVPAKVIGCRLKRHGKG